MPDAPAASATHELHRLHLGRVLLLGTALWWKHLRALVLLSALFILAEVASSLLLRYGLYESFSLIRSYSPESLLRELVPWGEPQYILRVQFTGPFGRWAGLFGILGGVASLMSALAVLRAVSLAFHGHGAPLRDSVRTAVRQFLPAIFVLLRQTVAVLLWPLVLLGGSFLLSGALRVFQAGATLGPAIAHISDGLQWVGLGGSALLFFALLVRVVFALPALIDQGSTDRHAVVESRRITEGAWLYAVAGTLVLFLLEEAFTFAVMFGTGVAAGATGLPSDAMALVHAALLVAALSILSPLLMSWWYLLYRNLLTVRGGAPRRNTR